MASNLPNPSSQSVSSTVTGNQHMSSKMTSDTHVSSNASSSSNAPLPGMRSPFSQTPSALRSARNLASTNGNSTPAQVPTPITPMFMTSPSIISTQSSPDGLQGQNIPYAFLNSGASAVPPPLQLPEPTYSTPLPSGPSAMSEAIQQAKGPGLMRRLSGRASEAARNRFVRRRQSSNNVASREQSSGPVIMRRRSGSKTGPELDIDTSDGLLEDDDSLSLDSPALRSEGTPASLAGSLGSASNFTYGGLNIGSPLPWSPKKSPRAEEHEVPVVIDELRRGSLLKKVTKKKQKDIVFILDHQAARVSWNSLSKKFYVDDIQSIRVRGDARNYREEFGVSEEFEKRWFTIVYTNPSQSKGRPVKTMHLIAPTEHLCKIWICTLENLNRYRHAVMKGLAGPGLDESTLQTKWKREMDKLFLSQPHLPDEESLDFPGVEAVCRSLHINCSRQLIQKKFDKADSHHVGRLNYEDFKNMVKDFKNRKDIEEIFERLVSQVPERRLDFPLFLRFLTEWQGIDVTERQAHWEKVFAKIARDYEPDSSDSVDKGRFIDSTAFAAFLSSPWNRAVSTKASGFTLDRPINEYYVSSSHNTYLLGRQVAGVSSTEGYIRALQAGCRCVEIDCWDGADGRPIVVHGRTFTSSILFGDCISVIKKHAFEASSYPLILSLEVHCNSVQQQAMVDIMLKDLDEALVREPIVRNSVALPSPEDLRGKILVKVKAPESFLEQDHNAELPTNRRQRSGSSPFVRPQAIEFNPQAFGVSFSSPPSIGIFDSPPASHIGSTAPTSASSASEDSDVPHSSLVLQKKTPPPTRSKSKIIKSLGDLGVYTCGLKYRNITDLDNKAYNHIFSLSEGTFENACRDDDCDLTIERHNARCLMRVYPAGKRFRSTNFDPISAWRRGVQMAALNYQTYDEAMQINEAMFAAGVDRTGYVLKPTELRSQPMDIRRSSSRIWLYIDMISAQFLECPRADGFDTVPNPYVEIQVYVADEKAPTLPNSASSSSVAATAAAAGGGSIVSCEGGQDVPLRDVRSAIGGAQVRRRTAIVPGNGYNPSFKDESFRFEIETRHPDLVFVRFSVWNSHDGRSYVTDERARPESTFTAKLNHLNTGYRHLPLSTSSGEQFLFSTLFCDIRKDSMLLQRPAGEGRSRFQPRDLSLQQRGVPEKVGRFKQIFLRSSSERKSSVEF